METSAFAQSYILLATCHLIDETGNEETAAVYLPNGFFVILSPVGILTCCEIGAKDVSKILLFHTHEPSCKYYLLSTKQSLIIVLHEKAHLKVIKTFDNISKFLIGDSTVTGRPHLYVWLDGQDEPITADFENQKPVSSESPLTYALHRRLQLLKVHLEHQRRRLHEKQCLRKKTVEQLFYKTFPNENEDSIGCQNILIVKTTWQRLYQNRWILGAVVKNTSNWPVTHLYLCAKNSAITSKVLTKSFHLPSALSNDRIGPGETAYVVGTLNLPLFPDNSSSLDINTAFFAQLEGQLGMTVASASWNLNAFNVLNGSLTLFRGDSDNAAGEEDVASFCAIAQISVDMEIRSLRVLPEGASLHDFLTQKLCQLGFKGTRGAEKVILTCVAAGLLVKLEPSSERTHRDRCRISVRAMEAKDSLLLVRALRDFFPNELTVVSSQLRGTDPAEDPALALSSALTAELQAIQSGKARSEVAPLEVETDLALDTLCKGYRA